ncbi:imelysin family protein [Polaromonas aquatica]|uniref:imelysin family protein n=1 Tax=Polaromonas aquatica TaxID=332657 RepID=UPI003D657AE6
MNPLLSPLRPALRKVALAIAGFACVVSGAAHAQIVAPNVAVPFYTAGDFMRSAYRFWYAPQAHAFAEQARGLPAAVSALCDASAGTSAEKLAQARERWKTTALAWDRLSGVQVGPLVQRRSARQIDFTPTRPELIKRAIQAAPQDATAMESIGTPAKGLPALEWLLWSQPVSLSAPATPACRYAVQVSADIQREADALAKAFNELAAHKPGEAEENNGPAMSELVNQWTGALERLRWAEMEKPRMAGAAAPGAAQGRNTASYARSASGQTAARWAAQWQALRTLGTSQAREAPLPGTGLTPLETYLRGLGRNEPANQLAQAVNKADKALQNLSPANKAGMSTASRSLADLKKLAEADIAPALEVSIGFSDADGD